MMFSIEINFGQKFSDPCLRFCLRFLKALTSLTLGGSPPVAVVTKDSSSRDTKLKTFENRPDDDEASDAMGGGVKSGLGRSGS